MPQIQARGEPLYPPHFVIRADSLVLVRVSRVRCVPQAERRRLVSRCSSKNAKTTDSRARERLCWRLDDNEDYDDVQLYVNRMPIRIRNKDRGRGGGEGEFGWSIVARSCGTYVLLDRLVQRSFSSSSLSRSTAVCSSSLSSFGDFLVLSFRAYALAAHSSLPALPILSTLHEK